MSRNPQARSGILLLIVTARPTNTVRRDYEPVDLIDFRARGGWCWFQDERAIVDGGRLIFGSVASPGGDVDVTTHEFASGRTVTVALHERFQSDDHDAPALMKLSDGRYLAAYTLHGDDDLMRWRISLEPGDATRWDEERTLGVGDRVTYANLYRLSAEDGGRIYNFHRGMGFDPNYLVSDDDGRTFRYGGRLFDWPADPARRGSGRPYVRYASDGRETIHFIATEDHPLHFANSIYHGFIRGGGVHRSDGSATGVLSTTARTSLRPTDLTRVFEGGPDRVAWTCDIRLDREGRPYVAFSVRVGDATNPGREPGQDLRYYHARWDGRAWRVHALAHAGTRLYADERDYSGLVALDPADAYLCYVSTNADPVSGEPLVSRADKRRHWEIFKGRSRDGGATWSWSAITRDSTSDNLRPIARTLDARRTVLIWLRGTYRSYTDYDLSVVVLTDDR